MAKKTKAKKSAKKPMKKAAKKAGAAKKSVKSAAKKTASKAKKAVKKAAKKVTKKTAKKAVKKTAKKVVKAAKKTAKKVAKKAAPKKSAPKKAAKVAKKVVKSVKKAVTKKAVKKVIKKAETPVVDAFKSAVKLAKKVVENLVTRTPDVETATNENNNSSANESSGSESSHTESSSNDTPQGKDEEEPSFVAHKTHLSAGDKAPFFEGKDQDGNTLNSAMFIGKNLILYFYPKDDTETCTKEACNLRDEYKYLSDSNYAVIGVSADDARSHTKFITKYNLPFPLLADTDMTVIKAYDVWGTKKFMGRVYDGILRTTFVIGPDGIIKEVITKVDSANHTKQILGM